MRELSLTEIGMVSGGKYDPNGGGMGGFGNSPIGVSMATGAASGGGTYIASVTSGENEFSAKDAAIAVASGSVGGMVGTPFKATQGLFVAAGVGSYTSKTILNTAKQAQSNGHIGQDNNTCKAGDDYNIQGKK